MGRDRQLTIAAVEAGPTLEEPEPPSFPDSADSAQEFRDRNTGLPLNPEMVKKARELEVQYVDELHVLEHSDRDTCMVETGRPRLTGSTSTRATRADPTTGAESRWRSTVDFGGLGSDVCRDSPLRGLSPSAELADDSPRSEVQGDDGVFRANNYSPLARVVFVIINGKVYKLIKAMYGLRDAGASFDREVFDVMNLMRVSLGNFSICVGYRKPEW